MVIGWGGIVGAESLLGVEAGVRILEGGGNAVDAGIATNAMMGVVEPMMNGIGGDLVSKGDGAKGKHMDGMDGRGVGAKRFKSDNIVNRGHWRSHTPGGKWS